MTFTIYFPGFINKKFDNNLSAQLASPSLYQELVDAGDAIASHFEHREFSRAIREIMALADRALLLYPSNARLSSARSTVEQRRQEREAAERRRLAEMSQAGPSQRREPDVHLDVVARNPLFVPFDFCSVWYCRTAPASASTAAPGARRQTT